MDGIPQVKKAQPDNFEITYYIICRKKDSKRSFIKPKWPLKVNGFRQQT